MSLATVLAFQSPMHSMGDMYLLQQICRQHQDFCIRAETLDSSEVADPLLYIFGRGHDFKYMEGSPGHIMPEHFEIYKLQQGRGLDIHVLPTNFCPTFFQAVLYVCLLVALVVPQSPYQVVEGFFKPMAVSKALTSYYMRVERTYILRLCHRVLPRHP